jgi:hypothetical protein
MRSILSQWQYLLALYAILAIFASAQSLLGRPKTVDDSGIQYTRYNNYVIFKQSFAHLQSGKDLYVLHPQEHFDLYKYTPTFSVAFGALGAMPDWLGLNLWNLLNALVLLLAIWYMPVFDNYKKGLILLICLSDLLGSMQNEQSNALMAGLLVLSFGLLERNKFLWAALCVALSVYIKLFGVVGFALFLLYPQKCKSALYSLMWIALLALPPLIFVNIENYVHLWQSYLNMLQHDHAASYGYSVMGVLHTWFGLNFNKNIVVAAGAALFMMPFALSFVRMRRCVDAAYLGMLRIQMLASVLIWIVIFNHKAESPSFIIAMAGIAIWFMASNKSIVNIALFVCALIFVTLSPTDIFPRFLREGFVHPYCIKAAPCILVWFKLLYDAMVCGRGSAVVKL